GAAGAERDADADGRSERARAAADRQRRPAVTRRARLRWLADRGRAARRRRLRAWPARRGGHASEDADRDAEQGRDEARSAEHAGSSFFSRQKQLTTNAGRDKEQEERFMVSQ